MRKKKTERTNKAEMKKKKRLGEKGVAGQRADHKNQA